MINMSKERTILIVDDDERNVLALSAVLKAKGFRLYTAVNGAEAINLIDEIPKIDLVLMDMMMPVMDGYQAIRKIRKNGGDIPIIALTAQVMKGDKERCIEVGADDYCSKPVNITDLMNKIQGLSLC